MYTYVCLVFLCVHMVFLIFIQFIVLVLNNKTFFKFLYDLFMDGRFKKF